VQDLDVHVVIGAASHWSKRRNTADDAEHSPNVEVGAFDYTALRELYARSAIIVVPLDDTDFQAGVTTILEAMAMGKPVIVTHSEGQTDVVEDRRMITRGTISRARPISLLRALATRAGVSMQPTGFYVPPNDPWALRKAIVYLLDHPQERRELGAAGRRVVEELLTVEHFGERLAALLAEAHAATLVQPVRRAGRAPHPSQAGR
jgi:glycosyltransferase involved in cell wall biosynthesis